MPLKNLKYVLAVALMISLAACDRGAEPAASDPPSPTSETTVKTPSREKEIEVRLPDIPGDEIPEEFTCDGSDMAPVVEWDDFEGAEEWIVTLTDPDAPGGTFVHWTVYGIPAGTTSLKAKLPSGARQGATSFGSPGYGGPCPPEGDGPHEYVFTVTALKRSLNLKEGAQPAELQRVAECCVIGSGRASAFYER
jgi:Raf kinase inhibitor-like YbhB/YbcL family protein